MGTQRTTAQASQEPVRSQAAQVVCVCVCFFPTLLFQQSEMALALQQQSVLCWFSEVRSEVPTPQQH